MHSIALIAKYFGKPSAFLSAWLFTAGLNPTVDFIFLTDDAKQYKDYPSYPNIHFFTISENEFAERALKACPGVTKINMKKFGYHCNQFRPMFGVMFEDLLEKYDFWGYVDTDVIFGDIRSFFADDLLEKFDKFLDRGHFTLIRNDPEVNKRYLLSDKYCRITYKQICKTSLNYGFDEMHGINRIYQAKGFPFFSNHDWILDCLLFRNEFSPSQKENSFFGRSVYLEHLGSKLFCIDAKTKDKKEILYAHFQKRNIALPTTPLEDHFLIVPNQICSTEGLDVDLLVQKSCKKTSPLLVGLRAALKKFRTIPRYVGLLMLFLSRPKSAGD